MATPPASAFERANGVPYPVPKRRNVVQIGSQRSGKDRAELHRVSSRTVSRYDSYAAPNGRGLLPLRKTGGRRHKLGPQHRLLLYMLYDERAELYPDDSVLIAARASDLLFELLRKRVASHAAVPVQVGKREAGKGGVLLPAQGAADAVTHNLVHLPGRCTRVGRGRGHDVVCIETAPTQRR